MPDTDRMETLPTSEAQTTQPQSAAEPRAAVRPDYDSPWKEAIEQYFDAFLAFFFPRVHADIDWDKGYEFLNTELERVVRDATLGRRYADELVKVFLRDGTEAWLLIHIEVQGYPEQALHQRLYVYNYRIFGRYGVDVVTLVVLTEDMPASQRVPIVGRAGAGAWCFAFRWRGCVTSGRPGRPWNRVGTPLPSWSWHTSRRVMCRRAQRANRPSCGSSVGCTLRDIVGRRFWRCFILSTGYWSCPLLSSRRFGRNFATLRGSSVCRISPAWNALGCKRGLSRGSNRGSNRGSATPKIWC